MKLQDIAVDHYDDANMTVSRTKRQFRCPPTCFSTCTNNYQCQMLPVVSVCVQGCCCPTNNVNLETACSGGPAVAACLAGLCGQGYFCTANNFCCRCQSGNTTGPCVNQECPVGYMCNTNNFCCPLGSGGVLGPCVNGVCPPGYTCGAGNLCYLTSGK
uniref:CC domain-containing protein n=1 Tax=Angiostrongylus cantonensis TaxID=6313 RepID=A0A158PAF8_ANGCA